MAVPVLEIGNVGNPLLVPEAGGEVTVEAVWLVIAIPRNCTPTPRAPDDRSQAQFSHDAANSLVVVVLVGPAIELNRHAAVTVDLPHLKEDILDQLFERLVTLNDP